MFFATPIIRHIGHAPRREDMALQRFIQAATNTTAATLNADFSVSQTDDATTLAVDVPGLGRDQLQLRLEDNLVHLSSVEGAPRAVRRSWELPHEIDTSSSRAKLENGVLTLALVRRKPEDQAVMLAID